MTVHEFFVQQCGSEEVMLDNKFASPFESKGYYVATDTKIAVLVKKEDMPLLGYSVSNRINIDVLLNQERRQSFKFSAKELKKKMVPTMINEMDNSGVKECEDCKGEGDILCPCCDHEYTCDRCNGKGSVGEPKPTGRQIPKPDKLFRFIGGTFQYQYLIRLCDLANAMITDTIECFGIYDYKAAIFRVGVVDVYLMPFANYSERDEYVLKIKTHE